MVALIETEERSFHPFMHVTGSHFPADLSLAKHMMAAEEAAWEVNGALDLHHPDWPGKLEIVRTEAGFEALKGVWDDLLERSETRTPFLRWDWVRLWWELYGHDFELALVVAKDGFGVVEAIAPWVIGRSSSGARRYLKQLCWLGGVGDVEGEVMDFLVPAGREKDLTRRLCQGLRLLGASWQGVRLNKIPEGSPNLPILMEEMKGCTVFTGVVNIHDSRRTDLSGDWEGYAARHSGRWRRNLRKRWDAMLGMDGMERLRAGVDLSATEAMSQMGALHENRWAGHGSTFRQDRAWEFHRRLAEKWIPSGRAEMPMLAIGGRMVAGCYGFFEGAHFYHYQIGWDRQYASLSLGNLAVKNCVEFCLERGVKEYEMLSGEYRYKSEWCPEARRLIDVEGYAVGSPAAACFVGLRSLKRMIRPPVGAVCELDVGEG
jgi:CelD/BcsL family acetyltransferase involved in cellulose biosynthesis